MKCRHCGGSDIEVKAGDILYVKPAEEKFFDEKELAQTEFTHQGYGVYLDQVCGHTHVGPIPKEEKSQTERDLESLRCRDVRQLPWHAAVTRLILRLYEKDKC